MRSSGPYVLALCTFMRLAQRRLTALPIGMAETSRECASEKLVGLFEKAFYFSQIHGAVSAVHYAVVGGQR